MNRSDSTVWLGKVAIALAAVPLLLAHPVDGQTIVGNVVDAATGLPVSAALIQLLHAEDSSVVSTALTAEAGEYALRADRPGELMILVQHLGYFPFLSPPLMARREDATYGVDIELLLDPIEMEGITVTAERRERALDQIQFRIGRSPRSLARRPILRDEIVKQLERGNNLVDLIRSTPSLFVSIREGNSGPCFFLRNRYCLRVYMDGYPLAGDVISILPLDMIESVTVILPNETIVYPTGAILLFTRGPTR
ncbi:MAG: carboxypeptidase regulatory-like domain-containing protein [Gemmatimonadota bacterium]